MIKFLMKHHLPMRMLLLGHGVKELDLREVQYSFSNKLNEENTHLLKFIHFLNSAGAEAIIPGIEKPQGSFATLESAFQAGLKSEQTVTKLINNLVEIAEKEKDRATYSFLQWFVNEQVEEETLFQTILQKFEILGRDKLAVYQIDQSLAAIRSKNMTKQADQEQGKCI